MNKIKQALKSRTFWTIVLTIIVNAVNANMKLFPADALDTVNIVLGLITTYFHVTPSQTYTAPTVE